jgi:branched-subunit amino acid ABC-type transport system permease component
MGLVVGLQRDLVAPALLLGVVAAGLYGLLAVPLVLTYRVSRTIGFVQGGIAVFSMFFYWWLTGAGNGFGTEKTGRIPGVLVVVAAGAAIGVVYGRTVTGRLANWPRIRLTVWSLGWLLALGAATVLPFMRPSAGFRISLGPAPSVPSLFGDGRFRVLDVVISVHEVATLAALVVLLVVLGLVLGRTRTGVYLRAIADDPDASRWVGIRLGRVGTAVYGLAGGLSAFGGVLMTTTIGLDFALAYVVFLRALAVSVLGGFRSLTLALAGCLVVGIGETLLAVDGSFTQGQRETVLMGTLFGLVLLINRYRPVALVEAGAR